MTTSSAQQCLLLLLLFLLLLHLLEYARCASPTPECLKQECGDIKNISYPFRLASNPHCPTFSSFFELYCNLSTQKLYVLNSTSNSTAPYASLFNPLEVVLFLHDSLIVNVDEYRVSLIPNGSTNCAYEYLPSKNIVLPPQRQRQNSGSSSILLPSDRQGPYSISDDNVFASFGCSIGTFILFDTQVNDSGSGLDGAGGANVGGCLVLLIPENENNTECSNRTCCVSPLPKSAPNLLSHYSSLQISQYNQLGYNDTICSGNCSDMYASIFHQNYTDLEKQSFRLRLKWALPYSINSNASTIQIPDSVCFSPNPGANFTDVPEVRGYRCYCNPGYTGDGYANGTGCKDIDECSIPNQCIPGHTKCYNSNGSYICKCKSLFFVGDGRLKDGTGCYFSPRVKNGFAISGAILGLALLIGGFCILAFWWRERTKRKYFMQNGGLQLEAFIRATGRRDTTRLFSMKELKAATKDYAEHMKLGVGGFGTVFKGVLEDGREVAIKKANTYGDGNNEQFVNELTILTKINHRHIVKLLGCCLETEIPLLVYEYVSNGNLSENLEAKGGGVMDWEQRLKVARQTADALAYLHGSASPPILHRDVKSANVLLDEKLDAKVADFGVSRLVPEGIEHVSTAVQGTLGYLDPEYFQTLQLTDKSDVYSLGVMLVELITGLKPVDNHSREPRFANLALLFIHHMQEGRVEELIDPRLENNHNHALPTDAIWRIRSSIVAVATLACRCINLIGAERPSMSYVANELVRITQALRGTDDEDESEVLPLLPFKDKHDELYEAAAVVSQNAAYYIQSSSSNNSNSMSIDNSMTKLPTMPR